MRLRASSPSLVELYACNTVTAARILGQAADVRRFHGEAAFARWAGFTPVPDWSGRSAGRVRRHRAGNRDVNAALHVIALTQIKKGAPASGSTKLCGSAKALTVPACRRCRQWVALPADRQYLPAPGRRWNTMDDRHLHCRRVRPRQRPRRPLSAPRRVRLRSPAEVQIRPSRAADRLPHGSETITLITEALPSPRADAGARPTSRRPAVNTTPNAVCPAGCEPLAVSRRTLPD